MGDLHSAADRLDGVIDVLLEGIPAEPGLGREGAVDRLTGWALTASGLRALQDGDVNKASELLVAGKRYIDAAGPVAFEVVDGCDQG
ncbi:hypothetical protein [Gandjariella thermophila]|uniref:Uncharacterized protein n=1 Tax=Gandjariella thermophila TaxID=1931992 RepID=A0A4D4JBD1_9PSEU|nr:hypothetical protein [Gandjariella thermophila]GDY33961.1 hypothetical protein GTS_55940 [Gandjariella thermophila]